MNAGDLVRVTGTPRIGPGLHLGIITKQLANHYLALERFEVMTSDGNISSYTTASLRLEKNESR